MSPVVKGFGSVICMREAESSITIKLGELRRQYMCSAIRGKTQQDCAVICIKPLVVVVAVIVVVVVVIVLPTTQIMHDAGCSAASAAANTNCVNA